MADEGVIGATWYEAKAHPFIIGGAVIGLVILLYLISGSKPKPTAPQNFQFSYGPSDAQVLAGTQLAIAQQADTTSLALGQIQAGVATNASNNAATNNFNNDFFSAQVASGNTSAQIAENASNNQVASQGLEVQQNLATIAAEQATGNQLT